MTNKDFLNFVKHRPYYKLADSLGKFYGLHHKRLLLTSVIDRSYTFRAHCNLFDKLKSRSQRHKWLTEAEAMAKLPEYFL